MIEAAVLCVRLLTVAAGLTLSGGSLPADLQLLARGLDDGGRESGGYREPQAGTADPRSDETAVRDLVAAYNAARDGQDATAIAALFTESADQLVSSGEWRRGRDSLVRGMLESSRTNPGDRTITVETVRFLDANVALADARYEIAAPGGAEPRRMWSTFVAVRTPGGWRIAAIRNMLPAR